MSRNNTISLELIDFDSQTNENDRDLIQSPVYITRKGENGMEFADSSLIKISQYLKINHPLML